MCRTRIFLTLGVLVALLLVTTAVYGLPLLQIPAVPHPTEGREDCLACHDLGMVEPFPEDHEGRTNDSCTMCHEAQAAEPIPMVPHTLEGREDCLVCHDLGMVAPFPEDHAGRDNASCQTCHQVAEEEMPAATPEPTATLPPSVEVVPTPIHEPVLFEENTCISCHRDLGGKHEAITTEWAPVTSAVLFSSFMALNFECLRTTIK